MRRRLDAELVRRGLADSPALAVELIGAGRVLVGGAPATSAARQVDPGEAVVVTGAPPRWVGRGAQKLLGALDEFRLDPAGLRCLDAGASTGGFTDVLVQRGAAEVVALDVGRGQLHERLRADPRVVVIERTNLRHVDPDTLGPFDAVVADLSFISLTVVMEVLVRSCRPEGWLVVLVKPQFEVRRRDADRGRGIIREPALWRGALDDVLAAAAAQGAPAVGVAVSPVRGAEGNVEFLAHLRPAGAHTSGAPTVGRAALVEAAVAQAEAAQQSAGAQQRVAGAAGSA